MDLELIKEKIDSLQDMSVEEIEINYDTYFLTVETIGPSNLISGYSIKYKDVPIGLEYTISKLLETLERYEFYPKSYFEEVLCKKEEYSKKVNFIRKINNDIEKVRKEIFDLNMEIEHYKKINGIEEDKHYKITFFRIEDEVNKVKDNHSDLLNKENDK